MQSHFHPFASALLLAFVINAPATILYVDLNSTNATPPFKNWFTAATVIQDAIDAATPGDQVLVTNGIYKVGGRLRYGVTNRVTIDKAIRVQSVHGAAVTVIEGNQVPGTIYGTNAVRCSYLTNGATLVGFLLTNGAAQSGDHGGGAYCEAINAILTDCVLVGNSVDAAGGGVWSGTLNDCILGANSAYYGGGASGSILNRCVLTNNAAVNFMSLGGGAHNCVLNNCVLGNNSAWYNSGGAESCTLNSCTLTNNSGGARGGGACRSTLNHCVLKDNGASTDGGGASYSTLNNCILSENHSLESGGGAGGCVLNNCTIVNNSSGAAWCTANNCIVYYNGWNDSFGSTLNNCCTGILPADGLNNVTNEPLFIDLAAGDFQLQSNSPCINGGNNLLVTNSTDFDGNQRIKGGTVDIGAYEFQSPASKISYAWLEQYGLATDGSADYLDLDGDRMNNWQEWICGTVPTDALSSLLMVPPIRTDDPPGQTATWQSVVGKTYYLERSTNLVLHPPFDLIQSNIVGQVGMTSIIDTSATNAGPYFYRVGVQQ